MDLSNLKPAKGSTKNRKRIARGTGSGHGGTSTRGHKGAGSRSGNSRKDRFRRWSDAPSTPSSKIRF
jgi:large subunit ribosomal protein L15